MADVVANFFELGGLTFLGPFSQYMYKANLYLEAFLWIWLLPLLVLFIYYIIWDNIKWAKTGIWAILVTLLSLIVAVVCYCNANAGIYDYLNAHNVTKSKIEDIDYIYFAIICFVWTWVVSFAVSLVLKFFSVKGRCVPF